ncbi:Site-specific recombinase XerD [Devosia crocina]|uniref:Site-specific recombinase XerD n=2 Tax=Devosia crocina TaxID=429728 RepID=A0A1I7N964_9HYPH|nr:Site-specific recombinase XerD [Devosia crocina]
MIKPHKRAGIYYLVRRVPKDFAHLDTRGIVRLSTEIAVADDPRGVRAGQRVQALNVELEAYWRGLRDGQSAEARMRFEAARKRALAIGVTYETINDLLAGKIEDLVERVELLVDRKALESELDVAAVLGGEPKVSIMLSNLVSEYEEMKKAELALKSPNQRRKWKNPRLLAINNFIEVVGDKAIDRLTRSDALRFRTWWLDRIVEEDLDIGTANKNLGILSRMYRDYNKLHQMGLPPIFAEIAIEGEMDKQRAAFKPEYVEKQILAPGVLDDLNEQARAVLWIVAETGLRISEACALDSTTISLDGDVPYVMVRPNGRQLKVQHTARDIPLVGVALDAAKAFPNGFSRYHDKPDSCSALVNKYLGHRNLLPTDDHSFYSLRHTFEDRLTAVDAPEKIIAVLMGHKHQRPKYGEGPSLEQKQRWLQSIVYKPAKHAG